MPLSIVEISFLDITTIEGPNHSFSTAFFLISQNLAKSRAFRKLVTVNELIFFKAYRIYKHYD